MDQRDRRTALVRDKEFLPRCVGAVLLLIGLVVAAPASAQQAPVPEVSFPIVVSTDAGASQSLTLGYDPEATNGTKMDELDDFDTDAPPSPPSGTPDAWLSQDRLYGEIRNGMPGYAGQEEYRVSFQTQDAATEVIIAWNLPEGITGMIEDESGGDSYGPKDMSGEGSITVSPNDPDAIVTIEYSGSQPSINIQARFVQSDGSACGLNNTCGFRNTGAKIDFPSVDTPGEATLTKYRNGPDETDNIDETNVSEYRYVIESENLSFSGDATLRLAESTLAGMTNPNTVEVYRRDPPGSGSFNLLDTQGNDNGEVEATTSALGEFVLASDDASNPLPVELTQFTVRRDGETAVVQWRTATETNNAGFEVQHRGPGAEDYAEAGYVESKADGGTTTQPTSYWYEVADLNPGTHQFRLRQVDTDGTAHLSETVSLTVGMEQSLRLTGPSPNPVRTSTQIRFGVQGSAPATVELYNVLGQRIATLYEGTPAPGEMQTVRLGAQTLAGVPSGVYFVRLDADGASRTRRLTVVR